MTDSEWAACREPDKMLAFLREAGAASERKLRLFAAACCRRVWPLLTDERSRAAVKMAERFANGLGEEHYLWLAEEHAKAASPSLSAGSRPSAQAAAAGAVACVNVEATVAASRSCAWARNVRLALACEGQPGDFRSAKDKAFAEWDLEAASLLRDIFVGPNRPPTVNLSCLTPTVLALAQLAYERRPVASGELQVTHLVALTAALEAAGCTDARLLAHLRGSGPHVRGCFALDAILGRN